MPGPIHAVIPSLGHSWIRASRYLNTRDCLLYITPVLHTTVVPVVVLKKTPGMVLGSATRCSFCDITAPSIRIYRYYYRLAPIHPATGVLAGLLLTTLAAYPPPTAVISRRN